MSGEQSVMPEASAAATEAMDDAALVRAANLYKVFTDKTGTETIALDHLNITVRKGKMKPLIGPDGAGKTTFMRLL